MSGFFGVVSKKQPVYDVFYGTDYHSHLGTKRAGMVFFDEKKGFQRAIHSIESDYFRTKFEPDLTSFEGHAGMGVISDTDPQPILFNSHLGRFAVASVSRVVNIEELEAYFLDKKKHFTENFQGNVNPTEVVANLVCEEDDLVAGIENVYGRVKGSCSMLFLMNDRLVAARDKLGRTPLVIGKNSEGFAATTETSAFPNLDYEIEYYIGPGEVVEITADGYRTIRPANKEMQVCAFLWVYYGYPTSYYEGINVDETRYRCGAAIARKDDVKADYVCGIPDSGVGHAYGYSNERKIPYKRAYTKYTPTWPRSFMPQNQLTRDLVAKMKLIPNSSVIRDKSVVFLDDSIVRGTQLKDNTKDLRKAGAKQIHMRIACPPLAYPCDFLNFSQSRSPSELATRKAIAQLEQGEPDMRTYADPGHDNYRKMVEQIARNLGIDSLIYQELGDLVDAIGLPKEKLCTHCWDGTGYF